MTEHAVRFATLVSSVGNRQMSLGQSTQGMHLHARFSRGRRTPMFQKNILLGFGLLRNRSPAP